LSAGTLEDDPRGATRELLDRFFLGFLPEDQDVVGFLAPSA
jgi:hypothetical protein